MTKSNSKNTSPLPLAPLTPKEKAVLEYIEAQITVAGVSPSYQEIKDAFGFASFNSVQNYLKQLMNKGYVEFPPHQKRALRVLHPASSVQDDLVKRGGATISPISERPSRSPLLQARGEALSLPLLGRVAAGRPIERMEHNEFVEVPPFMVKNPSSTYVLQVEGDSMIDDGIWDGDYLLISKRTSASNGEIVVASVENEATVKRFYLKPAAKGESDGPRVELRPANPRLKSMWYTPDEVEIKGLVVGLLRKY